jgi:hypothetical protein
MGGCPLIWGSLGLYFRVFSQPRRSRGFHDIDRRLRCSYNESADTSYAKCVDNDGSLCLAPTVVIPAFLPDSQPKSTSIVSTVTHLPRK